MPRIATRHPISAFRTVGLGVLLFITGTSAWMGLTQEAAAFLMPAARDHLEEPPGSQERLGSAADGAGNLGGGGGELVSLQLGTFTDVPAEEISFGECLPSAPDHDWNTAVFARLDGRVAVIAAEDFRVVARSSTNGGETFGPEIPVAGGPGQLEAVFHRAALAADGVLHVAIAVIDPRGGIGLQMIRSADMGQTWSAPIDIVRNGDPIHDVLGTFGRLAIATASSGRIAVLFAREYYDEFHVTASLDGGQTWTQPVRVDPGASGQPTAIVWNDVAVGGNGMIHVAYVQNRGVTKLFYTRSVDGGLTFEPEREVQTGTPGTPDVEVAADGSVLIAYVRDTVAVEVLRSTNDGRTFTAIPLPDFGDRFYRFPVLVPGKGGLFPDPEAGLATVLVVSPSHALGQPCPAGPLQLWHSGDHGASFSGPTELAPSAYRGETVSLLRTLSGAWAIAWRDVSQDFYSCEMGDVLVRVSLDEGITWEPAAQASSGPVSSSRKTLGRNGMANSSAGDLVLAFFDDRETNGRTGNVHLNRSPAYALSFGPDQRIDEDASPVNPRTLDPDLATDGADHVYVTFMAAATGPYSDIYVAASADAGYTYSPPQRVSRSQPGSRINKLPQVLAQPDGNVYVLYQADDPMGGRYLWLNHSDDFGATWRDEDTFVGWAAAPCLPGYVCGAMYLEDVQFLLGPTGTVHVAWTDGSRVYAARSTDFGASFVTSVVDGDVSWEFYGPALCVHGSELVLAFIALDLNDFVYTVFGTVSTDGGESWAPPVRLPADANDVEWFSGIFCGGGFNGEALVAWSSWQGSNTRVFVSRWTGSEWESTQELLGPPGQDLRIAWPVFTSPTGVVVTYEGEGSVFASFSADGGQTFSGYQRLDADAPVPDAESLNIRPATDGMGNTWVVWDDFSAGKKNSLAMRHSAFDGAAFGPVYRLNRNLPQAGRENNGFWIESPIDTLPGVAFVAYNGQRSTVLTDTLVNAFDPSDFDRDGSPAEGDCNDSEPGTRSVPLETLGLRVAASAGNAVLEWTSQSATAGTGTVYDVVTGSIGDLRLDDGFARASCLASGLTTASVEDDRSGPPRGASRYYLVRARNTCGTGTYGNGSGQPDPRDALDTAGPCPDSAAEETRSTK